MGYTARESLRRKLVYLALLTLLFVGTAFGLGWAFVQGTP
jgi:amino acid transporter